MDIGSVFEGGVIFYLGADCFEWDVIEVFFGFEEDYGVRVSHADMGCIFELGCVEEFGVEADLLWIEDGFSHIDGYGFDFAVFIELIG